MTYFGFLARFVIIPILLLLGLTFYDQSRGRKPFVALQSWPGWAAIALHVLIAVVYTTPWDNYLVATRVWWYDPTLVTGITFGWVPLEEYTFFLAQTLLVGLWLTWLGRRFALAPATPFTPRPRLRWSLTGAVALLWVASLALLISGWQPGTYLALELAWALVPILVQVAFGGDILWHYRRLVGWALLPATLYLAATDAIAIGSGTWTIDPVQSTGLLIAGALPIEEFLFFLLTSALVVFGMVLMIARVSHARARIPTIPRGAVETP